MNLVPCTPNGAAVWTQRTTLAGVSYTLRFEWNQRAGRWAMDLADVDGVAITSGVALVTNYPLLRGLRDPRRPPGVLVVMDTQGGATDPTFSSLGARHLLVYYDPSELVG